MSANVFLIVILQKGVCTDAFHFNKKNIGCWKLASESITDDVIFVNVSDQRILYDFLVDSSSVVIGGDKYINTLKNIILKT